MTVTLNQGELPMKLSRFILLLIGTLSTSAWAEDKSPLYSYKTLSLELAYKAANIALLDCRKRGYSVSVAVVDRSGILQIFLRDQFAGPHTVDTAIRKAWTANSFKQSTAVLGDLLKKGSIPLQIQHNPGALMVGGGDIIEAGGSLLGAIGVSGAPAGKSELDSLDSECGKAGIAKITEEIEMAE